MNNSELNLVEFSKVDNTYKWDIVDTSRNFLVISLFDDADIETKPISVICLKMNSTLDHLRPQFLAIPGWSSPASLSALAWCCLTNTPAILMADSTAKDEPRKWWKEWIKSRVVRLFSVALVGGAPHVEYVAALGLARSRVFIGYDVVDNEFFSTHADLVRSSSTALRIKYDLPDRYFLASNRFIEKKNLSRMLDAYAAYVAQAGEVAWGLVLLGDGTLKAELKKQVDRLGLANRVHFAGFKQYDELPVFYGLASAFIHASTSEQWGLVVNEAMASGLPVLVSERCGCAPDLVKNGVNGFTFNPHHIEAITARMLQLSGAACDLESMGRASREIIGSWSPKTFAASMLKAADAALAGPLPRAGWLDRALLWVLMRR